MESRKRWLLVYGKYEGFEQKAVEFLCEDFSARVSYTLPVRRYDEVSDQDKERYNFLIVGTLDSNPKANELAKQNGWVLPDDCQGYRFDVTEEKDGVQTMSVIGSSEIGVMYGAVDFINTYLGHEVYLQAIYRFTEESLYLNTFSEPLRPFSKISAPSVKERGLWTWGHVVYDYKQFFKNMARLRFNVVMIWNDKAPINAKAVVEEAHAYGIKVIWGFSWGWDNDGSVPELTDESANRWAKKVLAIYEEQYKNTAADGIYFQTFTETDDDTARGVRIATAVTKWVNTIANDFYQKYPDVRIQFGLHANSVKNYVDDLVGVDKRMEIVWENCGSFPFTYYPFDVKNHEQTKTFLRKIATLRGEDDKFGVVLKSMSLLDWNYFEHIDGEFLLGQASKLKIAERTLRVKQIWKFFQSYWVENANYALDIIRTMKDVKKGEISMQALVENGLFEKGVWFPVALYSVMAWDSEKSAEELVAEVCKWECTTFANVE